ncbi:hypothetical protein PPYR_14231 [Photinus pyralis]|uniref:Uncharacterized protein n=2 Tax=Photinus pyralis TaxID=7054 RepID=A0A5N4A4P0_PHOPY|nr:uncharacterized protein LOC116180441 [Photinus pyralis]XP_031356280.1 uncharacterized protein LOC116180441 [Photinus pyralis]KAB0792272.1 hypothetical protein PPYR_14231 [Photinus pyralis]
MSRRRKSEVDSESESDVEYLSKKLQTLKVATEKRDINVLLLGETGVGKSTFINAFFNYLTYPTLKQARKGNLVTLIPAKFTIADENYEERIIQVGEDNNELIEVGVSATQSCRSYVYPIQGGKFRIRLIDTPGIGDTRGINQDNINFENILSFIGEMQQLNAICILLKPNNSRLTVMFEFCIKQLLSRLEKSASRNLIFIFTNTRSTFYRPGETLPALKKLLGAIDGVHIPLHKENIFCTDNEAFRFLAAVNNGVRFSSIDVDNFAQSWKKSVQECWRMLTYITGDSNNVALVPHEVKNTISVNEARRLIVQLSQPLADIAQLILDNIQCLERHKQNLHQSNNSLTELKTKLYIPTINLRVIEMAEPTTVCTSPKCSTLYKIGDKQKWHYHQKCHCPCYLTNVPKEIIGAPELSSCAAMNSIGVCKKCTCRFQVHMHIYYETEMYEDRIEDKSIKTVIMDKELALIQAKNLIKKISARINEYDEERETIIKITAKFACFLKANAITPYNDAYQAYLEYLIDRERSLGDSADYQMIRQFQKMLAEYTEEKNVLCHALNQNVSNMRSITADDIIRSVETLYNLKHNGQKIKQLFLMQKRARKDENQSEVREFIYKTLDMNVVAPKNKDKVKEPKEEKNTKVPGKTFNKYNKGPNRNQNRSSSTHRVYEQHAPIPAQQFSNNMGRDFHSPEPNPRQYFHIKQHSAGNFDIRISQTDNGSGYPPTHQPARYDGPSGSHYPQNRNFNRFPRDNPPPYHNPSPPAYYQDHQPPPLLSYDQRGENFHSYPNRPPPNNVPFQRHQNPQHYNARGHNHQQYQQNKPRNQNQPSRFLKNNEVPNQQYRSGPKPTGRDYHSEPEHVQHFKNRRINKNQREGTHSSNRRHNLDASSSSSDSEVDKYYSAAENRRHK